jgi:hypothetical protein
MFTKFSQLPVEIRFRIWAFAATPICPRVIQIFYNPEEDSWQSWGDGPGGLPKLALSSREAFTEVLKPYTKVFGDWFHFEHDTLFISDPMFTLRKPRNAFMCSPYAEKFKNIALTSDQCYGLDESHEQYPQLCPSMTTVLREMEGLTTFTVVLSEDGAGNWEEELGSSDSESESEVEMDVEDSGTSAMGNSVDSERLRAAEEAARLRKILDRREEEAIRSMSKGYFRHVGNLHFESAMSAIDYWDSWATLKAEFIDAFEEEKERHPDWVRPSVSIMVVRYGLRPLAQYGDITIHLLGDQADGIVEKETPEFWEWNQLYSVRQELAYS